MLLKHVNDLLDMSKIEARKLKIELQDTDVAALVRFLASHFAVLAADRRDRLRRRRRRPVRRGGRSRQAAARGHEPARQRLQVRPATAAASAARCGTRPQEITIAVDDSGPGVKPELRQAIFERFRQGDGGINRTVGGTGLGLAIAKEFVEMHKGRIEVLDSDLGGARFEVEAAAAAASAPTCAGAAEAGLDRSVLDGVIEELRFAGVNAERPAAPGTRAPAERRGPAARARRRGQPRHEPLRRECLGRDYDVVSGVRRPRRAREGAALPTRRSSCRTS